MKRPDILIWSITLLLAVVVCGLAWEAVPVYAPPSIVPVAAAVTAAEPLRIHLNRATAEELVQLNGLGDVLAARIVAYREEHGGFGSVEELLEVEGIGERRLALWRESLIVD